MAGGLAFRQAVLVPTARRAALRAELVAAGATVESVAPEPSWRNWLFADDDLLEPTRIVVNDGQLPAGSLVRMQQFPALTHVDLFGCDLTDADAAVLATYPALTHLNVGNSRITDAGVEHLAELPLVDLDLTGTPVTPASLATVGRITTLRRLVVPAEPRLPGIEHLASLRRLNVLGLQFHSLQPPFVFFQPHRLSWRLPDEVRRLPLTDVFRLHAAWNERPGSRYFRVQGMPPIPPDPGPAGRSTATGPTRRGITGRRRRSGPNWSRPSGCGR